MNLANKRKMQNTHVYIYIYMIIYIYIYIYNIVFKVHYIIIYFSPQR